MNKYKFCFLSVIILLVFCWRGSGNFIFIPINGVIPGNTSLTIQTFSSVIFSFIPEKNNWIGTVPSFFSITTYWHKTTTDTNIPENIHFSRWTCWPLEVKNIHVANIAFSSPGTVLIAKWNWWLFLCQAKNSTDVSDWSNKKWRWKWPLIIIPCNLLAK